MDDGKLEVETSVSLSGPELSPTLEITATATALQDISTCRAGFVTLHPADLAGRDVRIIPAEGGRQRWGRFPVGVTPQQVLPQAPPSHFLGCTL